MVPPRGGEAPGMRILIVEDEARIADFVARALSAEGYFVDVATIGAAMLGASPRANSRSVPCSLP